jgi:hypothetical protein
VSGCDRRPWYHGSQQELVRLRAGSSVSQNPDVARAFSHRPSLVSMDGGRVRHNGSAPGFLYVVDEEVGPEDVHPHPHPVNVGRWEWLTRRDLRVRLVERTTPRRGDVLSAEDVAALRRRQEEVGQESFAERRADEVG